MQQGAHTHDGKPEPLRNRKMLKLVLVCNHILIANVAKVDIITSMSSKHRKTLEVIFSKPIPSTLEWVKVEALLKEAKPYQVNDAKAFLELIGVKP